MISPANAYARASQKPDRTSHIRLRIVRTGSVSHSASHG
jgi:hypothetical protein